MGKRIAAVFLVLITGACRSADPKKPQETNARATKIVSTVALPNARGSTIDGLVELGGSPLPGATITISGPQLQGVRIAVSDANGRYHFVQLPEGDYFVRVEMESLQASTRMVHVASQVTMHVATSMKLGAVAEAITVTAAAPAALESGSVQFSGPPRSSGYIPVESLPVSRSIETTAAIAPNGAPAYAPAFTAAQELAPVPEYAPLPENAFAKTADARTTTFAIDVDRASYANVRHMLSNNTMPPRDAVRIEEMVNYFTYSYPQPSDSRPFSVTAEVAGCPWNLTHRVLRVGIQGRTTDEWQMAANNLVFLIDVSGSMEPPARLPLVKSGLRILVDHLRAQDSVAIVTYAGAAGLALPRTSGADKAAILAALDRLQSGGSTAGGAGIELAYKVAQENFITGGNNRVILCTDGDFNVGITSPEDLEKLITEEREHGVFLTAIGVGDDNFKDARMEMLADKGNGQYLYLDKLDEARKVFVHELTGTLVTIAKDVKVQLEFEPSQVAEYRQIGYEDRALANKDFEDDRKDAGDLGAGHSVTALYELVPAPTASATGNTAVLRLRYKQPQGTASELMETMIRDDGTSAYAASPDMKFALAVAEFGMLLRNSQYRGTATYADVLALARAARGADLEGWRDEFLRMAETARGISGEAPPAIAGK